MEHDPVVRALTLAVTAQEGGSRTGSRRGIAADGDGVWTTAADGVWTTAGGGGSATTSGVGLNWTGG